MKTFQLEEETYSIKEYLRIEAQLEERHEFHDGKIVAMAGGTVNHSLIAGNIVTALNTKLDSESKDCKVFSSDLKVISEAYNKGIYPDVMVICEAIESYEDNQTAITNPMLLIEVLSKSSKSYDKGDKFEIYRSIPSFQEYVLVYQTVPVIQTWYKEAKDYWRIGYASGLSSHIHLHSIDCNIALSAIYKRVTDLKAIPKDMTSVF